MWRKNNFSRISVSENPCFGIIPLAISARKCPIFVSRLPFPLGNEKREIIFCFFQLEMSCFFIPFGVSTRFCLAGFFFFYFIRKIF